MVLLHWHWKVQKIAEWSNAKIDISIVFKVLDTNLLFGEFYCHYTAIGSYVRELSARDEDWTTL